MNAVFTVGESSTSRMKICFTDDCMIGEAWIETRDIEGDGEWKESGPTVPVYLHELMPVVACARQLEHQAMEQNREDLNERPA